MDIFFIHKTKKLLKTKYNGSRIIISREKQCSDKLSIYIQTKENFLNDIDKIQSDIKNLTKINIPKVSPIIET